jgi:YD repeat-containing protein
VYYAYNAVGDLVRMEDWTGINTFEYDGANNLTAVTEDDGRTTTYEYDDCGNMVFEYIRGNGNNNGNGDGNGSINKTSIVVKNVVVDYNTETFEPLMEHEVNGLDYKYVYGNDRLSVDISPINNSMSVDPILDPSQYDLREYVQNPVQLVQYLYVANDPILLIDLLGLNPTNAFLKQEVTGGVF